MSRRLDRITLLETFVRIADTGSISAAARDLGLSQPSVSRQLAELEDRLKTQLMQRNTHALALTGAGLDLLADARLLIDSWEVLQDRHLQGHDRVQGKLKIVAPVALGQWHLANIAAHFQLRYPQVELTWILDDQSIQFSETGCDCWIKIGPVGDTRLVVRTLGSVQRMLIASSSLVAEQGLPKTPAQAERLDLLALESFETGRIPLTSHHGAVTIKPRVRLLTNNIFALKQAVVMGLGMAVLPGWFVAAELQQGSLLKLLPEWHADTLDINVAYLPGRHQPKRLRAFLDILHNEIRNIPGIVFR